MKYLNSFQLKFNFRIAASRRRQRTKKTQTTSSIMASSDSNSPTRPHDSTPAHPSTSTRTTDSCNFETNNPKAINFATSGDDLAHQETSWLAHHDHHDEAHNQTNFSSNEQFLVWSQKRRPGSGTHCRRTERGPG